ncbi:cyclin-like F-box [Apiospora sp. TS-2023a]
MPAPAFSDSPDPAPEITCIAAEPFAPKPLVADILRTKYCIPGSIVLVEDVEVCNASRSKRWRAIRLMLGDGELCLQALLAAEMHRYVDGGEVSIGSYVKLEAFQLEWLDPSADPADKEQEKEEVIASGTGTMPYLVVSRLEIVGWNNRLLEMAGAAGLLSQIQEPDDPVADEGHSLEASGHISGNDKEAPEGAAVADPMATEASLLEEIANASDDGDFEAMMVSPQQTAQKRAELASQQQLLQSQSPSASQAAAMASIAAAADSGYADEPTLVMEEAEEDRRPLPPWLDTDPTKPLKLTPLRGIPTLPYKQNWSTNVLAVVATISELQPSNLPPFRQRQARLAHPSTPKQVHLTVFLDPAEFAPQVGSVVLLLGVKNHRFDGGSLKKYASDRPRHGAGRWWFENPVQFAWCDVEGLQRWWDLRLS